MTESRWYVEHCVSLIAGRDFLTGGLGRCSCPDENCQHTDYFELHEVSRRTSSGSLVEYTGAQGMIVPRLIERKRDGGRITPGEWHELIRAYTAGNVPDYQMSALLMAIFFRGLDGEETYALTDAMLTSGEVLDLSKMTR